jgi:NAD(P)-dependent dehydrogenase (short-subunit alcohol dehydrogenase family)
MSATNASNAPTAPDRKVVLLTGGSGKIGTAFCERFATTYQIVAVRHRRPLKVASQLQHAVDPFATDEESAAAAVLAGEVFEIRADLKVEPEVARVVEVALARFGRIDVLVNAVGGFDGRAELLGGALSRAGELFTLNALVPTAVAVRIALDFWRHHDRDNASRNRVVVNLSATAGVDAADPSAGGAFGATKAAQNMLSMHLAEELRPFNVRVVTVAPAPVPQVVTLARVTSAIAALIEGDETGRLMLMWDDDDELV